jgi:hypothetical protein
MDLIREGLKELKGEIKLWKDEVKDHLKDDPILAYRPGECRLLLGQWHKQKTLNLGMQEQILSKCIPWILVFNSACLNMGITLPYTY